jgi:Velvet factor
MCVTLHDTCKAETSNYSRNADLAGTLVSSLHRVKDTENNGRYRRAQGGFHSDILTDVGYFVFQDLSIRKEGDFRLKFSLFELQRFVLICHFTR